jgi:hypothetical protein
LNPFFLVDNLEFDTERGWETERDRVGASVAPRAAKKCPQTVAAPDTVRIIGILQIIVFYNSIDIIICMVNWQKEIYVLTALAC